jgi:Flp pilus assembly protein TadG
MTRLHRDEGGAVLAIVALSFVALLGMAVLVVDVGGLLVAKRRMVTAADSAALAAALECASRPAGALARAQAQAKVVALENGATAGKVAVTSGACGTARGEISSRYRVAETLSFAPILGLGESLTVSAPAKAIWAPARGARSTPPVNLNGDGSTFPCAFNPSHPCNFWADNSDPDSTSTSNWSFLALEPPEWPANAAGNDPNRTCPNNDFNKIGDWVGGRPQRIIAQPTYVCLLNGRGGASTRSQQFIALKNLEGKTMQFPVADPALNVSTPGKEKFAVIGFVSLKIVQILQGTDPQISGLNGSCLPALHTFLQPPAPNGGSYNASVLYATCAALAPSNAVLSAPVVRRVTGNRTYTAPGDFTWNPTTKTISGFTDFDNNGVRAVEIFFSWSTPGPCGFQTPDPNSFCLITEWVDNQIGGVDPDPTAPDLGLRAVRLSE